MGHATILCSSTVVLQEHIYDTMFTSGEVVVESHGRSEVTEALVEALRLQWAYGYPYTPKASRSLRYVLVVLLEYPSPSVKI